MYVLQSGLNREQCDSDWHIKGQILSDETSKGTIDKFSKIMFNTLTRFKIGNDVGTGVPKHSIK